MADATRTSPPKRRPTRQCTHDRLTISLPVETAARLRSDAQAAGSPSLSAFVAETLAQRSHEQTFRSLLDEMFREQPLTDEERQWADAILDR